MRTLAPAFAPLVVALTVAVGAGAGACSTTPDSGLASEPLPGVVMAPEPQREGDPALGYRALVNEAYVPCGIPMTAYARVVKPAPESNRIPGREGQNETLAYNFTAMTTKEGVALVTSNCLTCHAGRLQGQIVVGLGAHDADFTSDQRPLAAAVGNLLSDPKERAEWLKWKGRVDVVAPYAILGTRGPNPADSFTAALYAHHDPKTLAWSETPLFPLPPPSDLPVDVPPWWRMKKKTSMFYVGGGRGDHARMMMTASVLCTSSVEESRAIDAYFGDIRAYIASIEPPPFPFPVDAARSKAGKDVFERTCARCHGTYGSGSTYPNLLVDLATVGTDPALAAGNAQFGATFVSWFESSFFGETARLEPHDGYVAPPLDGIWATAPFLHNGSVPTLEGLLDSRLRPTYWTRTFDSNDYDPAALGWKTTTVDHGKAGETDVALKAALYDTTLPGYSNGGHVFGDDLDASDRQALLEYLKTL